MHKYHGQTHIHTHRVTSLPQKNVTNVTLGLTPPHCDEKYIAPMKCQTQILKSKNQQKYGTPPPFFHMKFFYQNDSDWPKMDFKHNF